MGGGAGLRLTRSYVRNLGAAFKAPSHTRAKLSALLLLQLLASPRREKGAVPPARGELQSCRQRRRPRRAGQHPHPERPPLARAEKVA